MDECFLKETLEYVTPHDKHLEEDRVTVALGRLCFVEIRWLNTFLM